MKPLAVETAVDAVSKNVSPGARVLVRGSWVAEVDALLRARGFVSRPRGPAMAACVLRASAVGAVVPTFEALAEELDHGALVVASDLMWRTAPTRALLAAFPGTRPMEGYEMQVEEAGFRIVERLDAPRADLLAASDAAQREAIETDARGAALWRTLVLRLD
jgi:hypothetical protein